MFNSLLGLREGSSVSEEAPRRVSIVSRTGEGDLWGVSLVELGVGLGGLDRDR